jgi:hypothetical protein
LTNFKKKMTKAKRLALAETSKGMVNKTVGKNGKKHVRPG